MGLSVARFERPSYRSPTPRFTSRGATPNASTQYTNQVNEQLTPGTTYTMTVRKRRKKAELTESVSVVSLEPAAFPTPADRHRTRIAGAFAKRPAVDAANKHRLLQLMRHGDLPSDICDDKSMPTLAAFMAAYKTDDDFASDYDDAMAACADLVLQDAATFSRDCAATGNIDTARVADIYTRSVVTIIEKLSPRTHGALIKHAGSDAGPLQVAVINYARKE